MRRYYRENVQLNVLKAVVSLRRAESVLADFPLSGTKYEDSETIREYNVQGSAFSLLYTIKGDTVWIIDLHDQRGYRSAEALRHYQSELRQRMAE